MPAIGESGRRALASIQPQRDVRSKTGSVI
jgi:hypothetical protein